MKSFCISGEAGGRSPSHVKMFVNRADLDFALAAEVPPAQAFDLAEDPDADLYYSVRAGKFANVHHLTLLFTDSHSGEEQRIYYVNFKGADTKVRVATCVSSVPHCNPRAGSSRCCGSRVRIPRASE